MYHFFLTELTLPLFDFISDILNGLRLFNDCHPRFGGLTIGLVFAPMAVFVPPLAHEYDVVESYFSGWKKFLLPYVYPVAVILATPSYVSYICYVAIRRIVDIEYQPDDSFNDTTTKAKGLLPEFLKFCEITLESETQLILGESHNNLIKTQILFLRSVHPTCARPR